MRHRRDEPLCVRALYYSGKTPLVEVCEVKGLLTEESGFAIVAIGESKGLPGQLTN